jgi:hypothetical protein
VHISSEWKYEYKTGFKAAAQRVKQGLTLAKQLRGLTLSGLAMGATPTPTATATATAASTAASTATAATTASAPAAAAAAASAPTTTADTEAEVISQGILQNLMLHAGNRSLLYRWANWWTS